MAIEFSGFFDSSQDDVREYSAASFAEYFSSFVHNGVYSDGDNLKVYADGTGMKVFVKPGKGWINGYYYSLNAENANVDVFELAIAGANPTLGRTDRVVLRLNTADDVRSIKLAVVAGTSAASPIAPALTRAGDIYELGLATVTVAANTASVAAGAVTDTRSDTDVCGIYNAFGVVSNNNRRAELCRITTSGIFNPAGYPTVDGLYDVFIVGGGQSGASYANERGKGGYCRLLRNLSISNPTLATIGAGGPTGDRNIGGTSSFGTYNSPGGGASPESDVVYTPLNPYNHKMYGRPGGVAGADFAADGCGDAGGASAVYSGDVAADDGGEGCGGGAALSTSTSAAYTARGGKGGVGGGGGGSAVYPSNGSKAPGAGGNGLIIIYGHKIDGYSYPEVSTT